MLWAYPHATNWQSPTRITPTSYFHLVQSQRWFNSCKSNTLQPCVRYSAPHKALHSPACIAQTSPAGSTLTTPWGSSSYQSDCHQCVPKSCKGRQGRHLRRTRPRVAVKSATLLAWAHPPAYLRMPWDRLGWGKWYASVLVKGCNFRSASLVTSSRPCDIVGRSTPRQSHFGGKNLDRLHRFCD